MKFPVQRRLRKYLVIGVLLISVIVVVLHDKYSVQEPSYQGKRLSKWLEDLDSHTKTWHQNEDARAAIRAMGTNAVPFLVTDLRRGSLWEPRFAEPIIGVTTERRARAAQGLMALGPSARGAVADLGNVVDTGDFGKAYWALMVLSKIEPEGLVWVRKAMTNKNDEIRQTATNLLR